MAISTRTKVLFLAEGATLAHVARPFLLACGLDRTRFEITLARPKSFAWLTDGAPFRTVDLRCQDGTTFARRLDQGLPLYDFPTLLRYVADDLALIDSEMPDVVVGDFRLSLSVSARLRSKPYITVCDAYWSPERPLNAPLPVLPFTRFTPIPVAKSLFRCISPLAFRLHTIPLERLRRRHGLPSLGSDLRRCYTDADLRLFANFSALFPEIQASAVAAFIGPLAWSPPAAASLNFLEHSAPLIYVTMGSSGDTRVLSTLVPILERTGSRVVIASAGRPLPGGLASRSTEVFDFLPGDLVCRHARLVVCNGGSPTTNQALASGVPVLGIPRNMDQFLNMEAIERFGAGLFVRSDRASEANLTQAVDALLGEARFQTCASQLAKTLHPEHPGATLADHIASLLSRHGAQAR